MVSQVSYPESPPPLIGIQWIQWISAGCHCCCRRPALHKYCKTKDPVSCFPTYPHGGAAGAQRLCGSPLPSLTPMLPPARPTYHSHPWAPCHLGGPWLQPPPKLPPPRSPSLCRRDATCTYRAAAPAGCTHVPPDLLHLQ